LSRNAVKIDSVAFGGISARRKGYNEKIPIFSERRPNAAARRDTLSPRAIPPARFRKGFEMKVTLLEMDSETQRRLYFRSDRTFWEIRKDADAGVWSIWQIDPIRDEIVTNDPRNGISADGGFGVTLKIAIRSIEENAFLS
jgi:hypothetical protein